MNILVTGGAGYIGSHTSIELLQNGHNVIILDNLVNSKEEAIKRIEKITSKQVTFYKTDLLDATSIDQIFSREKIYGVIHFAGLKAVGESVEKPLLYYKNNLISTINLLESMNKYFVKTLIFSSSATVYGIPKTVPITEDFPLFATNPYGRTKLMIEQILADYYEANKDNSITILRYFNPVGAHESGLIGEDPQGKPNNLMPFISQVAVGKLSQLSIFGSDWPTADGTGVRDYIHVVDLAKGHLAALNKKHDNPGVHIYNLGSGKGVSVLNLIQTFEKVTGVKIPYSIAPRRPGDVAASFADSSKALKELDWKTQKSIEDMCRDAWNWQSKNPNGY